MGKFLNKKEQVIDLKLTTYGHYLLSIGTFKPVYYAFFDDNIIYDGLYAGITESQNNVVHRIKNETQYLEGQTLFVDLEDRLTNNNGTNFFDLDVTPTKEKIRKNILKHDKAIGDAHLDGRELNYAAAWKIVVLNGRITSNSQRDTLNDINVPQIDISLGYEKRTKSPNDIEGIQMNFDTDTVYAAINETYAFADGNTIQFKPDDAVIYVEEVNTSILMQNFDIEVFEVVTSSYESEGTTVQGTSSFMRKYFGRDIPQIVDGIMKMANPIEKFHEQIPSSSVEYYFDVVVDSFVDTAIACRGIETFNKQSYYIDLDIDCTGTEEGNNYYDIYGSEVEPEICLD